MQLLRIVAMALEALRTIEEGYAPTVHALKGHAGESAVAAVLTSFWQGSQLVRSLGSARANGVSEAGVQDYYSLRAVAHGFGAMHENLERASHWVVSEMNSVNDNPVVVPREESVYHTANFMGYYVSSSCDLLRADIAQAATWVHAILANLVHPRKSRGLPVNIIPDPVNHSGFRPVQILAASIAVQCRKLAQSHASFVLPTEGDNQDVNSLGTHSAFDLREASDHLERLSGVLLMAACQALEIRGLEKASPRSQAVVASYRKVVPFLEEDRLVDEDLRKTVEYLKSAPSPLAEGEAD